MKKSPHSALPVTFNNVNPGFRYSALEKDLTGMRSYGYNIGKALFSRTTEVGSRTLVHNAAAGEESHGQYITECKIKSPGSCVLKPEGVKTEQRLHGELTAILEAIEPGTTKNI